MGHRRQDGHRRRPDGLDDWVAEQFAAAAGVGTTELVVKDPRVSWFLPTWIGAAGRADARACVATMLRPPAEVVASKSTYYGGRMADSSRTAAWVNMMLETESMTRATPRAFVRYHDLLDDWTTAVYRAGEQLGLVGVEATSTDNIRRVHQFVDPCLRRVTTTWKDVQAPDTLRELAEETWEQLGALVAPDDDQELIHKRLDDLRASYACSFYEGAELLAMSSVIAARRRSGPGSADACHPAFLRRLDQARVAAPARRAREGFPPAFAARRAPECAGCAED